MDLELKGKVAIVTGGSRGIGRAVARQLSWEGVEVAIVARNRGPLEEAARAISSETGEKVMAVVADTTSDASVKAMVGEVYRSFGRIDILVNCAAVPGGASAPPRLDQIDDEAFFSDMNTKVMGYLRCIREVAPYMTSSGWGRIINLSGLAARSGGSTIGSMRNAAVVALTKTLADELGPSGVNVTAIHPGPTRTERTEARLLDDAKKLGISLEEATELMAKRNSIHRIIDASDIANVIAFLASPKSVSITGDAIATGGGGSGIYY